MRGVGSVAEDHAVVVAGDREDRPVVAADTARRTGRSSTGPRRSCRRRRRGGRRRLGRSAPPTRTSQAIASATLASFAIACAAVWCAFTFAAPVSPTAWKLSFFARDCRREELLAEDVGQIDPRLAEPSAAGPAGGLACAACSRRSRSRPRSCCRPGTRSRRRPAAGRRTACRGPPSASDKRDPRPRRHPPHGPDRLREPPQRQRADARGTVTAGQVRGRF